MEGRSPLAAFPPIPYIVRNSPGGRPMKMAFIVCNEVYTTRVMEVLEKNGIDYYTRWEQVKGKGHGTEAHLGTRSFPGVNTMLMIAFTDHDALQQLIENIGETNKGIARADDRIRLFQVPLERMV
jgi:nitrogen regulatory protein PII